MEKLKNIVRITDDMTLTDLTLKLRVSYSEVEKLFLELEGLTYTDQEALVSTEIAELIVSEFNFIPVIVSQEKKVPRSPVVTIMGHVDHGKTTLLDSLRNSTLCAAEFGGITQSIGAFKVSTANGVITFIDTPGHLAFQNMRAKGAEITDIIVLVVCASEGVQPQTVECINHALSCDVPVIVAINKIDLGSAEVERVEIELLKAGLILEKFGGEVLCVPISAKKKIGLDKLEETILFKAELMDLKESADCKARGFVLESKVVEGRGPLCSVIVKRGTLKLGDPIAAGGTFGIVKKLIDENVKDLKEVGLSAAAEVIGFKGLPEMGEPFAVTTSIERAQMIASHKMKQRIANKLSERNNNEKTFVPKMTYEERKKLMNRDPTLLVERLKSEITKIEAGEASLEECHSIRQMSKRQDKSVQEQIEMLSEMFKEKTEGLNVKVILKAKNSGMLEAIENSVKALNGKNDVKVHVLGSAVGNISNDDLTIAEMFGGVILCMNVKLDKHLVSMAERKKISIKSHKIIYHLIQDVENLIDDQINKSLDIVSGKAEVKNIYEVVINKQKTKIAGLTVTEGAIVKRMLFKVFRNGDEIANGLKAASLRILKENAKEVKKGLECGLMLEDFDELKEGDLIASYETKEIPKKFKHERKEISFEDVKDK